jgi:RNA polymerase sigma-70 factor (ECF subfamily)
VLQELFAGLVERPNQFGGLAAVSTWLYSATTHLALNRLRNDRNRGRLVTKMVTPATSTSAPPEAENQAMVRDFLAKLPEDQAAAAVYYFFDGLTHAEIAETLRCSRRHVGHLLERVAAALESAEEAWACGPTGQDARALAGEAP